MEATKDVRNGNAMHKRKVESNGLLPTKSTKEDAAPGKKKILSSGYTPGWKNEYSYMLLDCCVQHKQLSFLTKYFKTLFKS